MMFACVLRLRLCAVAKRRNLLYLTLCFVRMYASIYGGGLYRAHITQGSLSLSLSRSLYAPRERICCD